MFTPPIDAPTRQAWHAWRRAAGRPETDSALRDLYRQLDRDIAAHSPTCWISGKCCNFDAFGHRLYVTGLEIAWFLAQHAAPTPNATPATPSSSQGEGRGEGQAAPEVRPRPTTLALPQLASAPQADPLPPACRYQVDGKCSVHAIRPLGCHVFFCQQGTEHWQATLYERYLQRLRTLHNRLSLPYRYMEWRAGLVEADTALNL